VGLAKGRKQQVARFLSQIERTLHHRGRGLDGMSPRQDMVADNRVDLRPKAGEVPSLLERDTQMSESVAFAMLAEAGTDRHAQLGERQGRAIAVAILQAEVGHAEDSEVVELPIRELRRR